MRFAHAVVVFVLLLISNQAWAPVLSARSSLVVPTQFPTIQQAVNAARAGDTVQLRAGTYAEQVIIPNSLTLIGAGAGVSTIQAPPVLIPDAFGSTAIVEVNKGAKVTMSGLTVAGPGYSSCGVASLNEGILVADGATLGLSYSAVRHVHDAAIASCGHYQCGRQIRPVRPDDRQRPSGVSSAVWRPTG
jgi:nitrous oxidase accessory protein NosD